MIFLRLTRLIIVSPFKAVECKYNKFAVVKQSVKMFLLFERRLQIVDAKVLYCCFLVHDDANRISQFVTSLCFIRA